MTAPAPSPKGIVLAGGLGTRLYPATWALSKQLLPIYDKPMIYYPLSTLMLAEVRNILIITTPRDQSLFQALLGDGSQWGLALRYATQSEPRGLVDAFCVGESFLAGDPCVLILGDNLFFGDGLSHLLPQLMARNTGATLLAYRVQQASQYGVVTFNADNQPVALVEKPNQPRSNWAITGFYIYDAQVSALARQVQPSARGELEITDLNRLYLQQGRLQVETLGRGYAWLDTGTHDTLLQASEFVRTLQQRQGLQLGCLEEIALLKGWISPQQAATQAARYANSDYGRYIAGLVKG